MNGPDSLLGFWLFFYLSSSPSLPLPPPLSTDFLCERKAKAKVLLSKNKNKNKMLLGKRPRHPMKRTTSMTEITFDLNTNSEAAATAAPRSDLTSTQRQVGLFVGSQVDQRFLAATVSPRTHRKASADFLETAHFLRSCSLCKRRLVSGRDIYMYR